MRAYVCVRARACVCVWLPFSHLPSRFLSLVLALALLLAGLASPHTSPAPCFLSSRLTDSCSRCTAAQCPSPRRRGWRTSTAPQTSPRRYETRVWGWVSVGARAGVHAQGITCGSRGAEGLRCGARGPPGAQFRTHSRSLQRHTHAHLGLLQAIFISPSGHPMYVFFIPDLDLREGDEQQGRTTKYVLRSGTSPLCTLPWPHLNPFPSAPASSSFPRGMWRTGSTILRRCCSSTI